MKTLFTTLLAIGVLAFGTTVSAITINDTTAGIHDGDAVGDVDFFIAAEQKSGAGNEDAEETWVNSVLSPNDTVTWTVKQDGGVPYYSTDTANTFAFSLLDSDPRPDYFLVFNANFRALFENNAYVGWGVFDVTDVKIDDGSGNLVPLDMNLATEGFTVSHVTEFIADGDRGLCNPNLDPTCLPAVPIPPAVWLFGSGLIGLVGVARRKETTC